MQFEFDFGLCPCPVVQRRRIHRPRKNKKKFVAWVQLELNFNPPRNDKQLFLQLQEQYRQGSKIAERKMFEMLYDYAMKAITKEKEKKGFFISFYDMKIKAHNAATSTFMQYVTRPDFKIDNPLGYVYKWVQTELYYHTKVDDLFRNIKAMQTNKVHQFFDTIGVETDFF